MKYQGNKPGDKRPEWALTWLAYSYLSHSSCVVLCCWFFFFLNLANGQGCLSFSFYQSLSEIQAGHMSQCHIQRKIYPQG